MLVLNVCGVIDLSPINIFKFKNISFKTLKDLRSIKYIIIIANRCGNWGYLSKYYFRKI